MELYHFGVDGMQWGIRRYQNPDGTLTDEGRRHYGYSLSNMYGSNDGDDDYRMGAGTHMHRRTSSDSDSPIDGKYTYVYDDDNDRDSDFYTQFGTKVSEYTSITDSNIAGRKTLGRTFVDRLLKMENEDDENTLDMLDTLYSETAKRRGKTYVEGLFAVPFTPSKYTEELESVGAEMISKMIASQRNDKHDEKMKKRGFRDEGTLANDFGQLFISDLQQEGYSGLRDYNDYGSAANVTTPTVIFDPSSKLSIGKSWIDKILED